MIQPLTNLMSISWETVCNAAKSDATGWLSGKNNFNPVIGDSGWVCMGLGFAITVAAVILFQYLLVRAIRKQGGGRTVKFMDMVITSEDNSYSLSRIQIYAWTVLVLMGVVITFLATGKLPDIPENLYILMGLTVTTGVTATAVYAIKDDKARAAAREAAKMEVDTKKQAAKSAKEAADAAPGNTALADEAKKAQKELTNAINALAAIDQPKTAEGEPNFWRDLFYTSKNSLDLPRTQMFAWTVVIILAYIYMFVHGFGDVVNNGALPDIKTGMVVLMGVSQGAYVGAKTVAKS